MTDTSHDPKQDGSGQPASPEQTPPQGQPYFQVPRQPSSRLGRDLFFLVLGVAILGAGALFYARQLQAAEKAHAGESPQQAAPSGPPLITVETAPVSVGPAIREITTVGTLESNESVVICSEIAGRVVAINFSEGEKTERGDVLIRLDDSILKAQLDRAQANLVLHQSDFKRADALYKDHAISEQERDEAFASLRLDEASVRLAQAQLDKTVIRTPFTGTLGLRLISLGDYIQPGQHLVNLEDESRVKADFKVPQIYAAQVAVGQTLSIRVDALPGQIFTGQVYAINPRLSEQSRSLSVRGLVSNPERLLHPGQFAKLSLVIGQQEQALFVPEQAIIPQPKRQFVMKVIEGAVVMCEVQLGLRTKGWVEVLSGLEASDVVVTGGMQKIADGMPVHAVPAPPELFEKI